MFVLCSKSCDKWRATLRICKRIYTNFLITNRFRKIQYSNSKVDFDYALFSESVCWHHAL